MNKTLLTSLLLSTILLAEPTPQHIIDTGDKLTTELMDKLVPKLQHEMKTNGPLAAASFCHTNALVLTEEVNLHQIEGISVKRISSKYRNPANSPSADEAKVLESMQKLLAEKKLPEYIVTEDTKAYTYYKPLLIKKEACLKCHGELSKESELSQFLREHYPEDMATGYKMGDLRGAIVVEIKK